MRNIQKEILISYLYFLLIYLYYVIVETLYPYKIEEYKNNEL